MAMNNKGKHAHVSHACVPDAYTQKWCVHVCWLLISALHCNDDEKDDDNNDDDYDYY